MNILLLSPFFSPNVGGVESHLNKLIRQINLRGHNVIVWTYQPLTTPVKAASYEKREGLEIHRISWFGMGWFHKLEPYPAIELLYLFPGLFLHLFWFFLHRRKDVDVIHAHGFVCSLVTRLLRPLHRKRMVMSTHAIYHLEDRSLMRWFIRWMLTPFDKILAVGTPSRKELIAIGLPKDRITIHPNWIDLDYYKPSERLLIRKQLGLPGGFMVLFLSRMIDKKGVSLLLEASSQLPSDIQWVFVGDGPMAPVIKAKAQISKNIHFIGRIPQSESDRIPQFYSAADLFALPSQYEEGFAGAPLESLACGTPVLGSNKGCFPTDILDDSVGFMIEPTVENVVSTIRKLYEHPEQLERLKSNCRSYAERRFSEKNAEIIINSYWK